MNPNWTLILKCMYVIAGLIILFKAAAATKAVEEAKTDDARGKIVVNTILGFAHWFLGITLAHSAIQYYFL